MLSLPESMLLFALHDDKGSLRSAAYLSIDGVLRGALMAELMLQGVIQIRRDGAVRFKDKERANTPMLRAGLEALAGVRDPGMIDGWMVTLQRALPAFRDLVETNLEHKGALRRSEETRDGLVGSELLLRSDGKFEDDMTQQVRLAVACGPSVPRRMGILIGLIHITDLWSSFGDPRLTAQGRSSGEWVLGRDPLCQAVRIAVHKAEGTFEV